MQLQRALPRHPTALGGDAVRAPRGAAQCAANRSGNPVSNSVRQALERDAAAGRKLFGDCFPELPGAPRGDSVQLADLGQLPLVMPTATWIACDADDRI